MTGTMAAERTIQRAEWQNALFAPHPRRSEIVHLNPRTVGPLTPTRIKVFRNHAFEYITAVLAPYLAYAGYSLETALSEYDDALSDLTVEADIALVWLDFSRYAGRFDTEHELASWLTLRIISMREVFSGPILVADHLDLGTSDDQPIRGLNAALHQSLAGQPGVHLLPISSLAHTLGAAAGDRRSKAIGSRWSDRAFVEAARNLGLRWIPAGLRPRLKAICVDLDHTLYDGILGEDGVTGVVLTDGHRELQRHIVALRDQGLFIAIVSRNETTDVQRLFATRVDFPLRPEHISAWGVSWAPKADAIASVATALRIGVDSVLFVDDNPGELASATGALPTLQTLHAAADPWTTLRGLQYAPGLFAWRSTTEDRLRAEDLAASEARKSLLASAADPLEYLESLRIHLEFEIPKEDGLYRVYELSHKTNQFNMGLARFSEAEVARRNSAPDSAFVAVSLRDRLSDSGVIAIVGARRDGHSLYVDEVCISCRALGRNLEDVIVTEAVRRLATQFEVTKVGYVWKRGPRNAPALSWLERYASAPLGDATSGVVWIDHASKAPTPTAPVEINWRS